MLWGLLLPGPHLAYRASHDEGDPGWQAPWVLPFAEEQSHPGARDRSDEAGARAPSTQAARPKLSHSLTPRGPEDHLSHIQAGVWEIPFAGKVPELLLSL